MLKGSAEVEHLAAEMNYTNNLLHIFENKATKMHLRKKQYWLSLIKKLYWYIYSIRICVVYPPIVFVHPLLWLIFFHC